MEAKDSSRKCIPAYCWEDGRKRKQRIILAPKAALFHLFKITLYEFVESKFMMLNTIFLYTYIETPVMKLSWSIAEKTLGWEPAGGEFGVRYVLKITEHLWTSTAPDLNWEDWIMISTMPFHKT